MAKDAMFGRTVLVSGPESLLAERAVADLRQRALAEVPDALVNVVPAAELDAGQLAEITGGSLFSSASFAVIEDLANLPAELTDTVAGLAASTPDDVCLVLVHGGGVKGKGLLDKVKKARCEVIDVPTPKPGDLPGIVSAEARRAGVRISAGAVQGLIEAVGHDLRALAGAVAQLATDAEGGEVDDTMVRRYFAGRAEVTSFKVVDETMMGNQSAALELLRWTLETGTAPVLVSSAFASGLRTLGKYLDHRGQRLRDNELAALVGCPWWKLKELSRQAQRWDGARVAWAIGLVAQADADIKGAAGSADFTLERLVLQLSARP